MPKIFQMDDCDWCAGESAEEVLAWYLKETGVPRDTLNDPLEELTEGEMERTMFDEGDGGQKTFRAKLDEMVAAGEKFPCLFASTEY